MPENERDQVIRAFARLTEEEALRLGIHIWDEIAKGIALKMPQHLIPLVNEIFHKHHRPNAQIVFLSTEYTKPQQADGHPYPLILSDITFQIDEREIYHLEFQIDQDKTIIIRMLEYDFQIGMQHGSSLSEDAFALHVCFPYSAVIYPVAGRSQPDYLNCTLHFQDGSEHCYQVPVVKISDYKLWELFRKQLNILLPFSLLRFRGRIDALSQNPHGKASIKKELTAYLEELILGLETEYDQGILTEWQYNEYLRLVDVVVNRILHNHPDLRKEANKMTECRLKSYDDMVQEIAQEIAQGMAQDMAQGMAQDMARNMAQEIAQGMARNMAQDMAQEYQKELARKDAEIAELKKQLAAACP